jgi:nucleoside-diphosphate-sugar epimerase
MKIIITGATGSLGAHLVRHFAIAGHAVLATSRAAAPPPRLLEFAKYFPADISKPFTLPDADVIIHCAALADDHAGREALTAANITGTRNVCEAAKHIPKFIHVSSASVYPLLNRPVTESDSALSDERLLSPYGFTKLRSEEIVQETCAAASCFILRPRGIYGIGDRVLLPRALDLVRNGKMISPGAMDVRSSMTHFENFAHAVDCCIKSHKTGVHIYNVTDAQPEILFDTLKQLLDAVHGTALPVKHVPISMIRLLSLFGLRGLTPMFIRTITKDSVLDISKIVQELNYTPHQTFHASLPALAGWVNNLGGVAALKQRKNDLPWS